MTMSSVWSMVKTEFWLDVWTWVSAGLTGAWCFSTTVSRWWFWLPLLSGGLLAASFTVVKATAWLAMFSETIAKAARCMSIFVSVVSLGFVAFYGIGLFMVTQWCGGKEGKEYCKFYPHYVQVVLLFCLTLSNLLVAYYSMKHACIFIDCGWGSKEDEKKDSESGDSGDQYSSESDESENYDDDDD